LSPVTTALLVFNASSNQLVESTVELASPVPTVTSAKSTLVEPLSIHAKLVSSANLKYHPTTLAFQNSKLVLHATSPTTVWTVFHA
jgi:hypothetical protein